MRLAESLNAIKVASAHISGVQTPAIFARRADCRHLWSLFGKFDVLGRMPIALGGGNEQRRRNIAVVTYNNIYIAQKLAGPTKTLLNSTVLVR